MRQGLSSRDGAFPASWASVGISGRDLSGTGGSFPVQAGKRASWASVGQVLFGAGGQASIMGISALWLPNPSRDGEHHEHHWGRASPAETASRASVSVTFPAQGGAFPGQAGKRASWASVGQVLSGAGGQASIMGISALWLPNPSRDGEHHEHHWGRASPAEMGPFQHHGHQWA